MEKGEKKQTIEYTVTLSSWGVKSEARKIEAWLHRPNLCKSSLMNERAYAFPFILLSYWMYNHVLFDFITLNLVIFLEGLLLVFVNAGQICGVKGIFVERATNQGSNTI